MIINGIFTGEAGSSFALIPLWVLPHSGHGASCLQVIFKQIGRKLKTVMIKKINEPGEYPSIN